jgi:diacylglycerol kinase (ATP)
VLRALWSNLEEQEAAGSAYAALVRRRLRILVCGGDGTVAWVFKVITDLGIQPPPPVAIMPLGTGEGGRARRLGGGLGVGRVGLGVNMRRLARGMPRPWL